MGISFVGSASAATTSVTLPPHSAGDLILIFAAVVGSTAPTAPTGWTVVGGRAASGRSVITACKIAASSSEVSGTWTGAGFVAAHVYRTDSGFLLSHGATSDLNASTATVSYNALIAKSGTGSITTMMRRDNTTSWVVAAGFANTNTSTIENVPTGMTLRQNVVGGSTGELATFDTNGAVGSWSTQTTAVPSSPSWVSVVVEVFDTGAAASGGSTLIVIED
jgi:hypothetical protein